MFATDGSAYIVKDPPNVNNYASADDYVDACFAARGAALIDAGWREIDFSIVADVPHFVDNRGNIRHAAEGHAAPLAFDLSAFDSLTFDDPAKDGPE